MESPKNRPIYTKETLSGMLKPSMEKLKSGDQFYYSIDGCRSYYLATIYDIYQEGEKWLCNIQFKDCEDPTEEVVDLDNIIQNGLIRSDGVIKETPKRSRSMSRKRKRGCGVFKSYEYVEGFYVHLEGLNLKHGFHDSLYRLNVRLNAASIVIPALPERSSILIFDHYAKFKYRLFPYGEIKDVTREKFEMYKKEFLYLVNMFNEYGPGYTIFFGHCNPGEVDLWMQDLETNPNTCFAAYASGYNVIRFISNVFLEHSRNPENSFATRFGIEKLVGIGNLIADNFCWYIQDGDKDFNV
uniref:DUF3825 domain-containing protein n=1 Tax=Strongyloides papillosus TaxID=174720 RepID=A0A0N5C9C0_STREA